MTDPVGEDVPDIEAQADETVRVLRAITDPIPRAWAAENAIEAVGRYRGKVADVRRDALRALKEERGWTWVEIGREFGVTASRAQQIVEGRTR